MTILRTPGPRDIEKPDQGGVQETLRPGDAIGSFAGYLRRAKAFSAGLTAQIFGENGPDADMITSLHLTKFLDAHVKVTVWMIKDGAGKPMGRDGTYPKITEFVGIIKRPLASNSGQVAQFFGGNGANADAINVLNQSCYQDALVHIEMHHADVGQTASDVETSGEPDDGILRSAGKMTPVERDGHRKTQKKAAEAIEILRLSGFFRHENVLGALGRDDEHGSWMSSQLCCHPGQSACDGGAVSGFLIPGGRRYRRIPLCQTHLEQWLDGTASTPDGSSPLAFAESQSITYTQRWAMDALNRALGVADGRIPTPGTIYAWAADKKVHTMIPSTFRAYLV